MHSARLFIVCGLPGSGKTTRARQLAERFAAVRMSADDWMEHFGADMWDEDIRHRIESIQGGLTTDLLRTRTNVVVEWGTWKRTERDRLRHMAMAVGAVTHLEFLDSPIDVLWERMRARAQVGASRAISREELVEWSDTIERPTQDELDRYQPLPPVGAGELPGSPAFPYGSWRPT